MGNKQTSNVNNVNNPERSLSWEPEHPTKTLPPRRNSFATQPIISNGNVLSSITPRGYASSELGSPRYQKRVQPVTTSSKLGMKAINVKNLSQPNKINGVPDQNTLPRPPMMAPVPVRPPPFPPSGPPVPFYGSAPIPIGTLPRPRPPPPIGTLPRPRPPPPVSFGPGSLPPGPMGPPVPFMYPPYGPPPPPPMEPPYMGIVAASNDSKRIKKLRQRQKQKLARNESMMTQNSDFPGNSMFAIMPPPPPGSPPGIYGLTIYRTRSMDNLCMDAKSQEIKKHIFPTNTLGAHSKRNKSEINVVHAEVNQISNEINTLKTKGRKDNSSEIGSIKKKVSQQKVQILSPLQDGLTPVPDAELWKTPIISKNESVRKNSGTLIKSSWPPDVIYESLKAGNTITAKKGKGARKSSDGSPTAINIHFDYNEKDKCEKFVPSVTTVSSDAQAIMERNAKRLADAEWEDSHKPGSVVVNEQEEKEKNESDNSDNEKKLLSGYLPPRKVDAEVYEQRSLQRPGHKIQSLKQEKELVEMIPTEMLTKTRTASRSSSQKSLKSNLSMQIGKKTQNGDENGEMMIEAILNPVLNQHKVKKSDEFKALNAWNDISISSDLSYRRLGYGGSGQFQRGAVDEKIVVRLIPSPPPRQSHNQEPIYLDYGKSLPEFKKRLIETGNFDFPEIEKYSPSGPFKGDDDHKPMTSSRNVPPMNNMNGEDSLRSKLTTASKNGTGSRRQKYLMENRSKSNMERDSDRLVTLTPSIAKIKAGDCSDIDFSWVDDLETRFRIEREQFERELRNIKERTIQRGIKPLQPEEKTPTPSQIGKNHRSYSIPLEETSGESSSLNNSPKEEEYAKFQNNSAVSRLFAEYESKSAGELSKPNYLRDYSGPVVSSSIREDTRRPPEAVPPKSAAADDDSRCQPRSVFPNPPEECEIYSNHRVPPAEEEPVYIPKPDYEQMEREGRMSSNFSSSQFNPNDIANYRERFAFRNDYSPYFDGSPLTVQTSLNHIENTKRAYSSPTPRSPSQRKLNRYYNSNGNGTSNIQSSDSEWIEAEPEVSRDRYNMQLGGSYSINPNIANDFKRFDSPDKTFAEVHAAAPAPEYNGGIHYYRPPLMTDNQTRQFVEKMNEMSADEYPKWSRNPVRQNRFTRSMTNGSNDNNNLYISRSPVAANNQQMKYNFSRSSNGNHVYGSSHY